MPGSGSYEGEHLARQLKQRLENTLSAKLDAVADQWADTDPVSLNYPATYFLGFNPVVLEMQSSQFPYVAVLCAGREPDRSTRESWGYQDDKYSLEVHFFVVGPDVAEVYKRVCRYVEAIVMVLQADRWIESYQQTDFKPSVEISVAMPHYDEGDNVFSEEGEQFIQGGRVMVPMEGG
jgi:hypothetical protein